MSLRRLSLAAIVMVTIAVTAAMASPQATVVLTNGERHAGTLSFENNRFVLNENGNNLTYQLRQVASIEFEPGQPSEQELSSLRGPNRGFLRGAPVAVALRNGQVITGSLFNISRDVDRISIATSTGSRYNYVADDIARLYMNPSAARNVYARSMPGEPAIGTSGEAGQFDTRTVTVNGNAEWTPTGITVRQGQRVSFSASGQIRWAPDRPVNAEGATPPAGTAQQHYPIAGRNVGMLIGRVGTRGQWFLIGTQATVTMPDDGELLLGINDDYFDDNSGSFRVQISSGGAVGTSGREPEQLQPRTLTVNASNAWTPTNITVRRGQRLEFSASGQIAWSPGKMVSADGATGGGGNYPARGRNVGMLIGRVGDNGQPFPIGEHGSVTMPADGELFLGINDDYINDNSGSFRVEIGSPGTVGTSGRAEPEQPEPVSVTVPANRQWTSTNITVRRGQRISFSASGQIKWAPDASKTANPDGASMDADARQHYPVPAKGVGALVGRVGTNGQPFAVGAQGTVTMPADGELFLGVNDDFVVDNSGNFTVQISSASGERLR